MRPHPDFGPRTGRASLLILAILLAAGIGIWALSGDSKTPAEIPSPVSLDPPPAAVDPVALPQEPPTLTRPREPTTERGRPQTAARTDGIGSLRGRLLDRTGRGIPKDWTLVLSPNTAIRTPTARAELRIDFHAAEETFHIPEVPLGAYDVWIDAPATNRHATPVLLVRGSESPFISLQLFARGYLQGQVLDKNGLAVADLQVTLAAVSTQGDRTTRTDGAGRYLFDDLIDGDYQLLIGARHNPLIGPEDLSFQAPSLHYPLRLVPELGSVLVRAIDSRGSPIPGAKVDGFAPDGGLLAGQANSEGECTVTNLVPGRYRLSVRGTGDAVGRGICFIQPGEQAEIEVIVRD
jgi:hypothetical protein